MFQATFVNEKLNDRTLKFESERFTWIGRIEDNTLVGIIWHASLVKSVSDAKTREAILGAIGSSGTAATVPWALNRMIGTKFRIVPGYASSPAVNLAIERGEVEGLGSTSWETLSTKRDWIEGKLIRFLYVISMSRIPSIPGVPTIGELGETDIDRKALNLIGSSSTIGRALLAPPELPPARAEELRQSFDAMLKDGEFVADAREHDIGLNPLPGHELQRLVADVASSEPEVIARMQAVTRAP